MRIIVEKARNGVRTIRIVPGRASRMPPVTIRGTDKMAVREEAAEVIRVVSLVEVPTKG